MDNKTILVIDDDDQFRTVLCQLINDMGYSVIESDNVGDGVNLFRSKKPGVVITDLRLPGRSGYEVITTITEESPITPTIGISGTESREEITKAIHLGVWDFLTKPLSSSDILEESIERVLQRKKNMIIEQRRLQAMKVELSEAMINSVRLAARLVEYRDPYTAGHQRRVADLAREIAINMKLPAQRIETIHLAGLIHDIGKISVPAEILVKPGKLNKHEFNLIKEHSQIGYDMISDLDLGWPIAPIIKQHHERLDGSGYPEGLSGDDITLNSRIVTVADVMEAISSHRPYRPAHGIDVALEEIKKNKGKIYDPDVVDVCVDLIENKGYDIEHT